jgi:AcrR family transcriptional regulator
VTDALNPRPGRPREFDVDKALDRAVEIFWRKGYEGTTLTDLTGAMGISRPSMYAAFGTKDKLFAKALERYTEGPASYGERATEQQTARDVAESFLRGSATATTLPDSPHGCLGVQGALATGEAARGVQASLVEWRNGAYASLQERFQRAVDEGDLPADADASVLARFVITVSNGIAVQAASGVDRDTLNAVVDVAMLSWPSADRRRG